MNFCGTDPLGATAFSCPGHAGEVTPGSDHNVLQRMRHLAASQAAVNPTLKAEFSNTHNRWEAMPMRICRAICKWIVCSVVLLFVPACSVLRPDADLAAFSTQLTGSNEVPPVATVASGRLYAVLNTDTRLLRWKLAFSGLHGTVTAGHFHGPAAVGSNARELIAFKGPLKSPLEGQATLTPVQATDLLAGKWYVNLHTSVHPGGEIRGQLILRE